MEKYIFLVYTVFLALTTVTEKFYHIFPLILQRTDIIWQLVTCSFFPFAAASFCFLLPIRFADISVFILFFAI
uniref:Uncharacterized protein n=1 Tax=Ixodes ricinus TaxID=34613 RepID=A0A6B0TUP0_IXORI